MHLIKKSLCLIATLFITSSAFAQKSYKEMMYDMNYNFYEVVEAAEKYFEKNPKGKGSGYKPYMRWKNANEGKYAPTGNRMNVDHLMAKKTFEKFTKEHANAAYKSNGQANSWEDLGPYSSFWPDGRVKGIGRVECFWVNPNNDQELFLGSRSGGFWKTNNGGSTWKNTTDHLFASGVNTITVNPFNQNEILINIQNARNGVSHGIYRSLDRGNTWTITNINPTNTGFGGLGSYGKINVISYHPRKENLVFIGTNTGIRSSSDNLNSWTDTQFYHRSFIDIEFHPTSDNIIYAISNYNKTLIRSTDFGRNFTLSNPIPGLNSTQHQIAVSPTQPNNVWFASKDGIWKSIDNGMNFNFITTPPGECEGFAVSDLDEKKHIYGYVDVYASTINESTFIQSSGRLDYNNVHADLRTAECVNGVFYIGTDGFFSKSVDNGETWIRLNEYGTGIRENYAFSICQAIDGVMMGGSQDNGTTIYSNNQWLEFISADGMESVIHPLNEKWMVASTQYGSRTITKHGGYPAHYSYRNPGDWEAPLLFDPNNHMKLYNFTNSLHVSFDYENNWEYVGSPNMGNIKRADIANNNSNFIAVSSDSKVKLSKNAGKTWKDITNNLGLYGISDITFNPKNDNTIIVSSNNHNGNNGKIFITYNLGETWSNITYNLDSMPIRDVAIDHTDDNNIYVGAEIGIYTMPINGTSWTLYNKDLPNVTVTELEIKNGTNEIYAGTWGRGFWKTDLVGRSTYPKILTTRITDTPTESLPEIGSNQIVTSIIDYSGTLTNVQVKWSVDDLSFNNAISMRNVSGNTWVSNSALPSNYPGDKVYFKVFATGNNNDISETYKFMYEVRGECDSEILSQTGNEFKGENNNDLLGLYADVNAEGNIIAIGSNKYDYQSGIDNGLVQVFDQINDNWVQVGNDIAGSYNQQLGTNVSISSNGKRLAVGYKFDLGYTKVFELNGNVWSQLGNTIYSNSGEVKLSGDGNTLITSEWSDDTFGNNFGIVNVFELDGASWNAKGNAFSTATGGQFGFGKAIDISFDGTRIAVSSYIDGTYISGGGSVTIFEWNENNRSWVSLGNTIYGNIANGSFGAILALNDDGSIIAIGAKENNSAVYKLTGNIWQQVGGLIDPSFFLKNWSTIDISGDGKTVLLSNPAETVNGNSNFGAVARYKLENENWNKTGNSIYGNTSNKYFGINAAMSKNGKVTIVGGYNNDLNGYAKIYATECTPETTDYCGSNANTLLFLPFDMTFNGVNGETPLSSIAVGYTRGKYDKALNVFEGSDVTSLKYAANNNINPQKGTVEAWVKPTWNGDNGKGHTILQYGAGGGLLITKDGANNLRLILNRFSPSGYPEMDVSTNIGAWRANQWKHIAFTWGNGELKLYIDGTLVSEQPYTGQLYPINDTHFNIGTDDGWLNWQGAIDHLRISNTVRSENEINNFMNGCTGTKLAHHPTIEMDNFPNPFADQTTISYTLPEESPVTLTVYNGMGKQVALLSELETKQAGRHSIDFDASSYPTGIYYYTLKAGNLIETQKMVLIR